MIVSTCKTFLVTPAMIQAFPVGTRYAMLSDLITMPEPFTGYNVVAVESQGDADVTLLSLGALDCPEFYPSGTPVCTSETVLDWQEKQPVSDPCPDHTDEEILLSATIRGII